MDEPSIPAWLAKHAIQTVPGAASVFDDRTIVRRYFPRDVRDRPDLVVGEVVERCARCARHFEAEHDLAHVWKLRSGVRARAELLTLCDACDRILRPHAYVHFYEASRPR